MRVRGVADVDYAGQRIAIASGGEIVARARVGARGGFSASVPRPRGERESEAVYVATAGSARSAPVALLQPLRIERVRSAGPRRVRITALLDGAGRRPLRARVERRVACGRARTVARPVVEAAAAGATARRIVVTVARPARGQGTAAVRLLVGARTASLPLLVTP